MTIKNKDNNNKRKKVKAKYVFRKKEKLHKLLKRIKLWPSRKGLLHGIKAIEKKGNYLELKLYCGEVLEAKNSKNSRAARWLRNKIMVKSCPECQVPDWKLEKYSKTAFN